MMKAIVINGKNWGKTFGKLLIVIETSSAPPPIEVNRMSLKIQNMIDIVMQFIFSVNPPVVSADQNIVGEAHPSPELEAGVRNLPHQSPALQLAHRGQLGHIPGTMQHCILIIHIYTYNAMLHNILLRSFEKENLLSSNMLVCGPVESCP